MTEAFTIRGAAWQPNSWHVEFPSLCVIRHRNPARMPALGGRAACLRHFAKAFPQKSQWCAWVKRLQTGGRRRVSR